MKLAAISSGTGREGKKKDIMVLDTQIQKTVRGCHCHLDWASVLSYSKAVDRLSGQSQPVTGLALSPQESWLQKETHTNRRSTVRGKADNEKQGNLM